MFTSHLTNDTISMQAMYSLAFNIADPIICSNNFYQKLQVTRPSVSLYRVSTCLSVLTAMSHSHCILGLNEGKRKTPTYFQIHPHTATYFHLLYSFYYLSHCKVTLHTKAFVPNVYSLSNARVAFSARSANIMKSYIQA